METSTTVECFNWERCKLATERRLPVAQRWRGVGDDIAQDTYVLWKEWLERDKDTPFYHSVAVCWHMAFRRYWANEAKHSRKPRKTMRRWRLRGAYRRQWLHEVRSMVADLADHELTPVQRKVVGMLAQGCRACDIATTCKVSRPRVTQILRRVSAIWADDNARGITLAPPKPKRRRVAVCKPDMALSGEWGAPSGHKPIDPLNDLCVAWWQCY